MTINLPPRRALPADVKERMRPAFTEPRARRNHASLAVAAGVALLVAGGVIVAQSFLDRSDPANARVVTPSPLDLNRCRAALNDQNWRSNEMVVFDGRKVLVGKDSRFCELTRSRAYVITSGGAPALVDAGTITFRSEHITAGVPPRNARTALAREAYRSNARASTEAVVTPDFFIAYSTTATTMAEVVFDDRTTLSPPTAILTTTESTNSFESGDGNPWAPVNTLARCIEDAVAEGSSSEDLQGWQPMLASGPGKNQTGLLLARRADREWATCSFFSGPGGASPLRRLHTVPTDPQGVTLVASSPGSDTVVMAARTNRTAKTVEVSIGGGPAVTADVTDGFFIVTVPVSGEQLPGGGVRVDFDAVHVIARNADNQIVYTGGVA